MESDLSEAENNEDKQLVEDLRLQTRLISSISTKDIWLVN